MDKKIKSAKKHREFWAVISPYPDTGVMYDTLAFRRRDAISRFCQGVSWDYAKKKGYTVRRVRIVEVE